jgi:preprotein translocase subunit YajC
MKFGDMNSYYWFFVVLFMLICYVLWYKSKRKAIKDLIKLYPGMISGVKRKANEFTIQLTL